MNDSVNGENKMIVRNCKDLGVCLLWSAFNLKKSVMQNI